MSSLQIIIIPVVWTIGLGAILYFRFRKDEDTHSQYSERRKNDRRDTSKKRALRRMPRASRFDGSEKRLRTDRRQNEDWREEYRSLKRRIENDRPAGIGTREI